jgi:biotin transport system substrate-specific component
MSYSDIALSRENKTIALATVLLFAALTAIGAQMRLPMQPVPFTMQSFFVLLSGLVLGPYLGALSQLVYIAMGLAGAPIFAAAPHFGPAVLFGPTGGYLWGFVLASHVTGRLARKGKRVIIPGLAGLAIIYLCGFARLSIYVSSAKMAWEAGIRPFLPGDLLKIMALKFTLPGWNIRPILAEKCPE